MKISEERNNEVLICTPDGEININNSPELRQYFDDIIKRNEKKVIIDFSLLSYIDSSGLATLIEMFQRLKKIGGHMRLSTLNEKVKNVFEITKMNKIFEIFKSREAALKDF